MKQTRSHTTIRLAFFALLATAVSAGLLRAEDPKGTFTLPFEVRWGTAVLPAGDYSFQVDNTDYIVTIRGENQAAMVLSMPPSANNDHSPSALIIVRHGKRGTVRTLRLAEQNVVFTYPAPKGQPPLLAQAPELLQRIPILMASK
jgi:hypothetical protein